MTGLKIGRVAQIAKVRPSAIRFYEEQGLLPRPMRRSGRRIYDRDILLRLTIIALAKDAGFTIREIRHLLTGYAGATTAGKRWSELAERKLEEVEARIIAAQRVRKVLNDVSRCSCHSLDDCARLVLNEQESASLCPTP